MVGLVGFSILNPELFMMLDQLPLQVPSLRLLGQISYYRKPQVSFIRYLDLKNPEADYLLPVLTTWRG